MGITRKTKSALSEPIRRPASARYGDQAVELGAGGETHQRAIDDHARRVGADKRGGGAVAVTLDERLPDTPAEAAEVLALDQALGELEKIDERAARVVQLHFFGGLSFVAIAELEGLNERTIKRDWQAARHMLAASMNAGG